METHYRATLRLDKVEPSADGNGYRREHTTELAAINVTGDTPADAMVQLCAHADSLHDWHAEQADDGPAPVFDEAVRLGPPLFDISKLFRDAFGAPGGRHRCAICRQPGPAQREGNTYVCAPCNAVVSAAKAEEVAEPGAEDTPESLAQRAAEPWAVERRVAAEVERACILRDNNGRTCVLVARHGGKCDFTETPTADVPQVSIRQTDGTGDGEDAARYHDPNLQAAVEGIRAAAPFTTDPWAQPAEGQTEPFVEVLQASVDDPIRHLDGTPVEMCDGVGCSDLAVPGSKHCGNCRF